MSTWLTDDEQQAWRGLLSMTGRLHHRLGQELQNTSELSHADYAILATLSDSTDGRLRVIELADRLAWEQSRTSHQVSRMVTRRLVTREECPRDRRGAFVRITREGSAELSEAAPAHVMTVKTLLFDGLTREQVTALREISEVVLSRLAEDQGELAALE